MTHNIVAPYFRNPISDITGGTYNHQVFGECPQLELKVMDCLEAYGIERGKKKCIDLLEDFHECERKIKQYSRYLVMKAEREKQIKEGKLTGDKKFVNPRPDAY